MLVKALNLQSRVEAGAGSEGNRFRAAHDQWRVVKENLVHHSGGERGSVHGRSAFDHHARNLKLSQAAELSVNIRPSVGRSWHLLYANPTPLQFAFLLFIH